MVSILVLVAFVGGWLYVATRVELARQERQSRHAGM
jgi:hypothetical protein